MQDQQKPKKTINTAGLSAAKIMLLLGAIPSNIKEMYDVAISHGPISRGKGRGNRRGPIRFPTIFKQHCGAKQRERYLRQGLAGMNEDLAQRCAAKTK